MHHRSGALFERTFERKLVYSEYYLKNLIFYIHNNPVSHGFVKDLKQYRWSSYDTVISNKPTKLIRDEVIELFGGLENVIDFHT